MFITLRYHRIAKHGGRYVPVEIKDWGEDKVKLILLVKKTKIVPTLSNMETISLRVPRKFLTI